MAGFFGQTQVGDTCRWEIRSSKAFCASRDAGHGDFKEVPTGPARLGVLGRLAAGGRLRLAQSRLHSFRRDPVNPVRPDRGSLAHSPACLRTPAHLRYPAAFLAFPGDQQTHPTSGSQCLGRARLALCQEPWLHPAGAPIVSGRRVGFGPRGHCTLQLQQLVPGFTPFSGRPSAPRPDPASTTVLLQRRRLGRELGPDFGSHVSPPCAEK